MKTKLIPLLLLSAFCGCAFVGTVGGVEPAEPGYTPTLRLDAKDAGIILRHGDGPNQCDINGAREPTLIEDGGKYHLFYDGGGPKGWLACLATSSDLKTWKRHGPVLDFGKPGEPDAGSALSPWFVKDGGTWHMYYVTAAGTAGPPGFVAAGPCNSGHTRPLRHCGIARRNGGFPRGGRASDASGAHAQRARLRRARRWRDG